MARRSGSSGGRSQTLQMSIDRLVGDATGSRLGGACLKHFFPCDEASNDFLIDVKGGIQVKNGDAFGCTMSDGGVPNTKRLVAWTSTEGEGWANEAGQTWFDFQDKDVLIVACGQAVFINPESTGGGCLSFYVGRGDNDTEQLKIQPYYASFFGQAVIDDYNSMATLRSEPHEILTEGQDYIFAGAKNGDFLKHWADGRMTGIADIRKASDELQQRWSTFTPNYTDAEGQWAQTKFGHSIRGCAIDACKPDDTLISDGVTACDFTYTGHQLNNAGNRETPGSFYDDGNCGSTSEVAQDYYGMAVFCFQDGMPDDVPEAIQWMKDQWVAGNKVIWPAWDGLQ